MTRRARAIARPASAASRLLACFALLAFLLQGFALQTHVHQFAQPILKVSGENLVQGAENTKQPAPLKAHDPLDQGACRLCQELVHAGSALAAASPAMAASLFFTAAFFMERRAGPDSPAPGFFWQSRAPPRH